ncbi:MAG: poly-gamma-glutamate hydrolase family protein [Gammaproteobacteria bacterium]|nr:poly-gamma-glutamate hydrolase family protein [Gammaproteobacteria bacterium]
MDKYSSFDELRRCEIEGHDYRIRLRSGLSDFAIIAPHGGKIERGTSQIADAIACAEHSFYSFDGVKDKNNHHLHITSDRFDEPQALRVAGNVKTVIAIHGAKGKKDAIYTGGLDRILEQRILDVLHTAGFTAEHDPSPTRQGMGMNNICNRGRSGQGVQLELTQSLRKRIFNPVNGGINWIPNELFHLLVQTIRAVLAG